MTNEQPEYTFGNRDEFNRKPIAETLIKILESNIDISPMIIDGNWGTGKTEFCHKTIALLDKEKLNHIYIDAFASDNSNEPLLTILPAIIKSIPEEKTKKALIKPAISVAKFGLGVLAKAGISHILRVNSDDLGEGLGKAIQESSNHAIDYAIEQDFKDYEKANENLKDLQDILRKLAKDKPMIIFIDELDRCRPDFAVKMIEVIKHTFDIENIKFVLVMNAQQLKNAINHAYGASIDSHQYLDKFIKYKLTLPNEIIRNGRPQPLNASENHFISKIGKSKRLKAIHSILSDDAYFKEYILFLIRINQLSLREIDTLVRHIEIASFIDIKIINNSKLFRENIINFTAIFIHCFKPNLAKNIFHHQVKAEDILEIGVIDLDKFNTMIENEDSSKLFYSYVYLILIANDVPTNSIKKQEIKKSFFNREGKNGEKLDNIFINSKSSINCIDSIEIALNKLNFTENKPISHMR